MKKRILCFLLCTLMIFALSACGSLSLKPAELQNSISIPEDGVISSSVFKELKEQNKVTTFVGVSNGFRYEWTVFGSDIDETKDLNLGIEITSGNNKKIAFHYLSGEDFGFSPVLSIYLNEKWEAESATVYEVSETDRTPKCSASVTGSDKSILNFSAVAQTGYFEITPDITQNTETDKTEISSEKQDTSSVEADPYLSGVTDEGGRVLSDGKATEQDKYKTDPVPEGKPMPVEPENQTVNDKKTYTCTFSIECSTILNNLKDLEPDKMDAVPSNGIIFAAQTVTFYEGESVYDVLQRICKENGIQMEASWTPIYNSAYVEGIHNLYEFDCGSGSGWMYRVDGWYPNYGCSRYQLKQGEVVEWRYTCDLGKDIGGGYAIGG